MSSDTHNMVKDDEGQLPPLSSAQEISPANYPRAWFDDSLAFAIKEEARRRAPNQGSVWRHRIGFAGELGTSAYFQTPVNRQVYDGYSGDEGYDIECMIPPVIA